MKVTALGLRFACELTALAAFVWWGWPLLGVAIAVAVAVFWGAFIGPKSARRLPDPWRFGSELVIFAGATAAFLAVDQPVLAVVFAVVAVVTAAVVRRWPEP
jgi:uncharacterized membrane protein YfcA